MDVRRPRFHHAVTALAIPLLVAGCVFDADGLPVTNLDQAAEGAPRADSAVDGPVVDRIVADLPVADLPCSGWGYNPLHLDPCLIKKPSGPLLLAAASSYTYDTDKGTLTGPGVTAPATEVLTTLNPPVRVIVVDRLKIPAGTTLRVEGAMPLVVASWDDIDIQGTLDVSSSLSQLGAGANPATCGGSTGGDGAAHLKGGGGGGGGGLGGDGGAGATGSNGSGGAGGAKGVKIGKPNNIRGGCAGGGGGNPGGGDGGGGGGAVYLAAKNKILIAGLLHAGGAGGEGAKGICCRQSGGGGGSGGYLGLEAPAVTLAASAVLAANGGGGGGGNDKTKAGDGKNGPPAGAPAAAGGTGTGNGGDGGAGAILGSLDGSIGESKYTDRGAGGGGGGVGFIIVNTPTPGFIDKGATVSPLALFP